MPCRAVVAAVNVISVLCCFAVGLLVQCSVVTTAQHEERKRQRRMRRGKRQDRSAGLGGEDDDDGSSSASSASSDGGDGDRSRPLVRGLDAEDFKRYTDVRGSHMAVLPRGPHVLTVRPSRLVVTVCHDTLSAWAVLPVAKLPGF